MRLALILLAILAIAIGVAGLVLPRLVDPEAVRARVVADLQGSTGLPLSVRGTAELSLLPRPTLSIGRVSIGRPGADPAAGLLLDVDRVDLVLTPLPLIAGRAEIESVRLVRPQIHLQRPVADLSLVMTAMSRPESTLDSIEMVDARLTVGAGRMAVEQLELVARRSATGEVSTTARGVWDGHDVRLAASGRLSATSRVVPVEAELQVGKDNRVTFGGTLQRAAQPGIEGRVTVAAADPALPARLLLALAGAPTPEALAGLGAVQADARLAVAAGRWRLAVERLTAAGTELGGELVIDPGAGQLTALIEGPRLDLGADPLAALRRALSGAAASPRLAGPVTLRVAEVGWGTGQLGDARIEAVLGGDGTVSIDRATAQLPGNADLAFDGTLRTGGDGPTLAGRLALAAPDLPPLLDWLGLVPPALGPDRLRSLDLAAAIEVSPAQVALRELQLRVDSSRIAGGLAFGLLGGRPQIAADLDIDRLTLDGYLPGDDWRLLGPALAELTGAVDLAIDLDLASLGWRAIRAEAIRLEAAVQDQRFTLGRLSSANLAEASVNLVGNGDLASGELSLALDALIERPGRLLRLLGIDAPAPLARFAPLRLDGTARTDADAYAIELAASVPGLTVDATTRLPRAAGTRPERLQLDARAQSLSDLLARLGFPARTGAAFTGEVAVAVDLGTASAGGTTIDLDLQAGPTQLDATVTVEPGDGRPRLTGRGTIAGLAPEHIGLALEIGELALGFPAGPPSRWPGAWPREPLSWDWLRAADLDLALDWPAGDATGSGQVGLRDAVLELLVADAPLADGSASGTIHLDGTGPVPALTLRGRLDDVRSSELLRLVGVSDGVSGRLDLEASLAAAGGSIAGLVAGLAGDGRLTLRDGRLTGLRFGAPRDALLTPETPFDRLTGWLVIERGVVVGDGLSITSPVTDAALGFRLDLLSWVLEATARPRDPALPPVRLLGVPGRLRNVPLPAP